MSAGDTFAVRDRIVVLSDDESYIDGRVVLHARRGDTGVVIRTGWSPANHGDGYPWFDVRLDRGNIWRTAGVMKMAHRK